MTSQEQTRALHQCIAVGDEAGVRRLLEQDPSLADCVVESSGATHACAGHTALHEAVRCEQPAILRCLLAAGADPELRNSGGRTPLHDTAEAGRDDLGDLLLEYGAVLDICTAAIRDRLDVMSALLDTDPSAANDRSTGISPLAWAAYGDRSETASLLLSRGARFDDDELICAASVGHVEVARVLLAAGGDPNQLDENGTTPLLAAARMTYTFHADAFVRLMLEAGADCSMTDGSGRTPLQIAEAGLARENAQQPDRPLEQRRRYDLVIEALRSASRSGNH